MWNTQDLTGQKFNKLTVISLSDSPGSKRKWNCICECGNSAIVAGCNLKTGHTKSCGCYFIQRVRKHGLSRTSLYKVWASIKDRCFNPNNAQYSDYGARGITMCQEWAASFEIFMNDIGKKPSPHHTLDRENNDGNYEPSNFRWATRPQQARNTRRNIHLEYNGESMVLQDWAHKLKIHPETLRGHVKRGKSIADVIAFYSKKKAS